MLIASIGYCLPTFKSTTLLPTASFSNLIGPDSKPMIDYSIIETKSFCNTQIIKVSKVSYQNNANKNVYFTNN